MSSELNNVQQPKEPSIFINGKEYKQSELSQACLAYITVRQDLVGNRNKHLLEIEKIDVLTKHFDSKIEKELESLNKTETTTETAVEETPKADNVAS